LVEEAVNGSPNPPLAVGRSRRRRAPSGSVSPRLLSAQAAAAYTGWPYTTLRDAALRGYLPVVRIPGSRRMWFDRSDLDRAIEAWKEQLEA
jgi:excisionase family DNA binding protein